jgi:hypothetical protein
VARERNHFLTFKSAGQQAALSREKREGARAESSIEIESAATSFDLAAIGCDERLSGLLKHYYRAAA